MNNNIAEISQELIKFKTETGNHSEIKRCFDYIISCLPDLSDFKVKRYHKNGYQSLVISKSKEPGIFLVGHIDVVPAIDTLYAPKVRGGRIYGRGACDMKGPLAAMLVAFGEIIEQDTEVSVGLMLTSDEERGGFSGVNHLLSLGYKPKIAIIPDGGNNFSIVEKEKGVLHLKVSARGKSAHASRSWLGENAIEALCESIFSIKKLFPKQNRNHWQKSINIGKIHGGSAVNSVPDIAVAHIDIRLTENDKSDEIIGNIREVVSDKVKVEVEVNETPTKIAREHPEVLRLQKIFHKKTGSVMNFEQSHGTTDSRHFYKKGVCSLIFMPKSGGHHSKNEWINIRSLNTFYEVLLDYIKDYHYHNNKD
jgi:succinyl-diaminopimelate desuccinylase